MSTKVSVNGEHVLRRSFREESEAIAVDVVSGMEMAIELAAEDGDSVICHNLEKQNGSEKNLNTKGMKSLAIYAYEGTDPIVIEASPSSEGEDFIKIAEMYMEKSYLKLDICAARIRIVSDRVVKSYMMSV